MLFKISNTNHKTYLRVDELEADDADELEFDEIKNEPPRDEPRDILVDVAELLLTTQRESDIKTAVE